ncbi:MAG: hypothetical protein V1866_07060 [archaeon]
MDITLIVLIMLGVIIIYFATTFIGKALGILVKCTLLLIVLLAILIVLAKKDLDGLSTGLVESNNTFFLYEGSRLHTAITLKPAVNRTFTLESFGYFTKGELKAMEQSLNSKDYAPLLGSNYKLFILTPAAINRPFKINLGVDLNENDTLQMLRGDRPYLVVAAKLKGEYNGSSAEKIEAALRDAYGDDEKIKGYLFAAMLINYLQLKDISLIKSVKDKELVIYPESLSFKMAKYLPII